VKITCLCPTYNRPAELAESIACFERQSWPDRELIILDDAGQYDCQAGDRWRLVSVPKRYPALGGKRNACAALASSDAEIFAVWDDDDIYAPWHLEALACAFRDGAAWVRPAYVVAGNPRRGFQLRVLPPGSLHHPGCAFRRDIFEAVGGYDPARNNGEDLDLATRLRGAGFGAVTPLGPASLHQRHYNSSPHLSGPRRVGYGARGSESIEPVPGPLAPRLSRDWTKVFSDCAKRGSSPADL
jgi:glycosyltransferase involved in cell wall biosynthesis